MLMLDGTQYTGYWQDDRQHGKGKLKTSDFTLEGEFFRGRAPRKAKLLYRDGGVYIGQLDESLRRHGVGVYTREVDEKSEKVQEIRYEGDKY